MDSKLDENPSATISAQDVVEIIGTLTDARIMAIVATGATVEQLEEAAAWAAGESDVMGELERPASGPVAEIYDILTAEEQYGDDQD